MSSAALLTGSTGLIRAAALTWMALILLTPAAPARAGISFANCVRGQDGSLTCDTVPTGNTLFDDKAAQYGLLQNASPGWSEFDPYQGYDQELGDGED
ncbi:MAG: hypothetical protein ACKO0M_13090 [Cyanobium sp.]